MDAEIKWLDDPEVFRVNQLPAHSDHHFYQSAEEMKAGNSSLAQSLNGNWKFCYSSNALERPIDFFREDFDIRQWDEIRVPGHIELAGYDKIHYINVMYPWESHYYRRPAYALGQGTGWEGMFSRADYNPTGSYVTEFDLEEGLLGKRVVICFEGVEEAMYLWLNGSFIGYAEDSFTPSEFDLTPHLKEKGNRLAVEVHKRSSAAFIEGQDFFRFFGIFRNVTLYAKPAIHLEDLWVKPELSADCERASLTVELKLSAEKEFDPGKSAGSVQLRLFDDENRELLAKALPITDRHLHLEKEAVGKVIPWEHIPGGCGNPSLYRLEIRLYDEMDRLLEIVPCRVGFRRIEIIDHVIYLNKKRLILNGVNRHEWSAEKGRSIGAEEMKQDMEILLRNNINAVRTCHYPNQIPWYELCDEKGIYLMSETNLESHGSWQKKEAIEPSWNVPGSLPQWEEAVVDRARSNFEYFKNHASVLFWSLGNESYAGDGIESMNRFFKEKEDGRLVHYEGVCHNRRYEDTISDVESRMYATPQMIRDYLDNHPKKPFILCEYMHAMGNSCGGMGAYIQLLDEYEMYQGGFIWDFIDQAIAVKDEVTGRTVLRYGGDFDDRPADNEFSGDGILFADRTEKPAMQEVRYYYGLHK